MARYILCPKCELNYIDADVQELCDVCLKTLSGEKTIADDLEAEEIAEETQYGADGMPVVEVRTGDMHDAYEPDDTEEEEDKEDASWRSYLAEDDEENVDLGIPDSEFEDEEEPEEEEEEIEEEKDDFEYVSVDDYDFDDDDEEDEEEEEEDF